MLALPRRAQHRRLRPVLRRTDSDRYRQCPSGCVCAGSWPGLEPSRTQARSASMRQSPLLQSGTPDGWLAARQHDGPLSPSSGPAWPPRGANLDPTASGGWRVTSGDLKELARKALETEFWRKIDRSGGDAVCWPWMAASRHDFGYGFVYWEGRHTQAARVAYVLHHGLTLACIDSDLVVRHLCPGGSNPGCCNPRHLKPAFRVIRGFWSPCRVEGAGQWAGGW